MGKKNIKTNAGMVASEGEMLNFVGYLKKLVDDLTDKMNAAKDAVDKMQEAGYDDNTYKEYRELFLSEVDFINDMNEVLRKSGEHYEVLADFVHRHNEHIMKSKYGSQFKIR